MIIKPFNTIWYWVYNIEFQEKLLIQLRKFLVVFRTSHLLNFVLFTTVSTYTYCFFKRLFLVYFTNTQCWCQQRLLR